MHTMNRLMALIGAAFIAVFGLAAGARALVLPATSPGAASSQIASAVLPDASVLVSPQTQENLMYSIDGPGTKAPTGITGDRALDIAAAELGRTDRPALIAHGMARRIAAEAATSVWIVAYPGGGPPPGVGPIGSSVHTTVDFTGLVIDDRTGEVLRGFGLGHQ